MWLGKKGKHLPFEITNFFYNPLGSFTSPQHREGAHANRGNYQFKWKLSGDKTDEYPSST